jgi:spoIIIJ-associated protein
MALMETVEASGKTLEEAKAAALEQLQATAAEVTFEVIEEPKKLLGFLGTASDFRVRATLAEPALEGAEGTDTPGETAPAEDVAGSADAPATEVALSETERAAAARAQEFLAETTRLMGLETTVVITQGDPGEIALEILGPSLGLLIGRHGATLDALQLLAAVVANTGGEGGARIVVDAEEYRARRKELLRKLALAHADKAKQRGQEVVIPDLKAFERRIVHLTLKDDPEVETYSEGEGEDRCLVISPRGM